MREVPISGPVPARVAALASTQRGRVNRRQLIEVGISRSTITRLIAAGYLLPEHPGVYAVGHLACTDGGREASALLAARVGALLSHGTALAWWVAPRDGVRRLPERVHLTVPGHHGGTPRGVAVHRSTILGPRDIRVHDGLPMTSAARTLLDLAAHQSPRETERALDRCLVERVLTLAEVRELLARAGRHGGRDALQALLDGFSTTTFTRSEAEERFLAIVRGAGIDQPLCNVVRHGFEIDFLWADAAYAAEIDGRRFHSTPVRRARDAHRDRVLAEHGIVLDRFTWTELVESPLAVAAQVAGRLVAPRLTPPTR